jgi:2,3-bisphosphoglycerate-dependent phosphoglycerate mutase
MKRLIVLRHGYTFEENEEPRRVGGKTDLPLVTRGKEKIQQVALFLSQYLINRIISSNLKRTIESANIVKQVINFPKEILIDDRFREIDYGPDENKVESEVVKRIGKQALLDWEQNNVLPKGWVADTNSIKQAWVDLASTIPDNQTTLVVTSAGIARFAIEILSIEEKEISKKNSLKINPGHISIFENLQVWKLKEWNYLPRYFDYS